MINKSNSVMLLKFVGQINNTTQGRLSNCLFKKNEVKRKRDLTIPGTYINIYVDTEEDCNVKRILTIFGISFVLVFACFLTPGIAAETQKPIAEVSYGSNGLSFMPVINYYQLALSVTGPNDQVFTRTFGAGSSPYFSMSDMKYHMDGVYHYELVHIPVAPQKRGDKVDNEKIQRYMEPLTQSGSFTLLGGQIINPAGQEGISRALDVVHLDDVIIDGSLCVGQDCVNGESFGFDTIRLKENNLRIHFQDTSNSASFPTNDWRIVVNDSANGGDNYFAVEDSSSGRQVFRVDAGAPANSLRVDSGGDLGIGTSNPVVPIHIADGNTPTLRLEQNGSSGFTPQTWDVAGNEANFFVRDATNGSTLPLKIKPGAPTSSIFMAANGNIGFSEESPDQSLHIKRTGSDIAGIVLEQTQSSGELKMFMTTQQGQIGTVSNHKVNLVTNSENRIVITKDGKVAIGNFTPAYAFQVGTSNTGAYCDGTTWHDVSSITLKEKIRPLNAEDAVSAFQALKPVRFVYKTDKEEERIGFIAEHVPELVATKERKGLSSLEFTALLTKVVQEQQKQLQVQKEAIDVLKTEMAQLKKDK